jgi:predicted O-methyltransferase YrrM
MSATKSNVFDVIYNSPAEMLTPERLFLYSLIRAFQPIRCLEIGSHTGGSALIIVGALDEVGRGELACIDPDPQINPDIWRDISHRATLIRGSSPEAIGDAAKAVRGQFQFAFIDGDHSRSGVIRDIEGVIPWLEDSAYVLLHDAHFDQVEQGITTALLQSATQLIDCGSLSVERSRDLHNPDVFWGGLHLLRFSR